MAFASCLCSPLMSLKIDYVTKGVACQHDTGVEREITIIPKNVSTQLGWNNARGRTHLQNNWSFVGGSRIISRQTFTVGVLCKRGFGIHASWLTGSQIASSVFTLGTASVLPFYTLMVFAPKTELTRKSMQSSIPYVILGLLYAYLLYLSWTPDTMRLMFASKYLLPELSGIAKMFSSEMTLASAWIHLLVVDLFAARQVFHDGMENDIETRHSVSLCLLFCPIGILTHVVTKAVTQGTRSTKHKH